MCNGPPFFFKIGKDEEFNCVHVTYEFKDKAKWGWPKHKVLPAKLSALPWALQNPTPLSYPCSQLGMSQAARLMNAQQKMVIYLQSDANPFLFSTHPKQLLTSRRKEWGQEENQEVLRKAVFGHLCSRQKYLSPTTY